MPTLDPESGRRLTQGVLAAVATGVALYAVAIRVLCGDHATISVVLADAGRAWPIIPFALGLLLGHFFWPAR